jgi:hypothetical protein
MNQKHFYHLVFLYVMLAITGLVSLHYQLDRDEGIKEIKRIEKKVEQLHKALDYCSDGKGDALLDSIKRGGRR